MRRSKNLFGRLEGVGSLFRDPPGAASPCVYAKKTSAPVGWSVFMLLLLAPMFAHAEVEPVSVRVPESEAWVGQKVVFFVEVRAEGPFSGATSFSIPEIPRTVIVKVGSPVVSSEEIEGDSWFVQTHEFVLFSQMEGQVIVPPFEVRYANKQGFTGPASDHQANVPAIEVTLKRPPGSDDLGFIVTTEEMTVGESWEPQPSPTKQGDVLHRTITQQADQMTGMALPPPPTTAPEGIRVYTANPVVQQKTERGDFLGTRSDTLTYLLQDAGTFTLPAIKYVWWKPKEEEFGTTTLPAVTIDVAPRAPVTQANEATESRLIWIALGGLLIVGIAVWQWPTVQRSLRERRRTIAESDQVARHKLLRACSRNDVESAEAAWHRWRSTQPLDFEPTERLQAQVADLYRQHYGESVSPWNGSALADAFGDELHGQYSSPARIDNNLQPINPRGVISPLKR